MHTHKLYPVLLFCCAFSYTGVASAQENKVDELEKQLRATQDYMFTEFGKLSKGEGEKGGGKKELSPVTNTLKKTQLKVLIRSKYEYMQEGRSNSGARVAPVSGFSLSNARFWLDGEVNDNIGYRLKAEFANKGNAVQLQEAYGTYEAVQDKIVLALGQRQPKTTTNGPTEYWPFADMLNSSDTAKWSQNDRGLGVSGRLLDRRFFYEAQMMNGNGIAGSEAGNDNYEFLYSLLLKAEPRGEMTPSQNDIKFTESFSPGFAVVGARSRDKKSGKYRQDKVWYSGMACLKWAGFYSRVAFASQDVEKEAGAAKDQFMWYAHLAYAMKAANGHIIEPLARYEDIDYNRGAPSTREKRATFGLNYYFAEEKSRLALNYTLKREKGNSSIDNDTTQVMYVIFF